MAEIEAAEKSKMREKCEKILAHGINCFINRQLIYNYPEEIFADAGGLGFRVYGQGSRPGHKMAPALIQVPVGSRLLFGGLYMLSYLGLGYGR